MNWGALPVLLLVVSLAHARPSPPAEALLTLKAQARACYLGFIELYEVEYLRGHAAGQGGTRCVRVSYLRQFSATELDEATIKVFRDRHGDAAVQRYRPELERVGLAYEPVAPGDSYTYCVTSDSGGTLLRDEREVLRLASADFAERFLQLWVAAEDAGQHPRWAFSRC